MAVQPNAGLPGNSMPAPTPKIQVEPPTAHEKVAVAARFSSWWARTFGVKVYYQTSNKGTCYIGRLRMCTGGQLILSRGEHDLRDGTYLVTENGLLDLSYTASFDPPNITRWWFI